VLIDLVNRDQQVSHVANIFVVDSPIVAFRDLTVALASSPCESTPTEVELLAQWAAAAAAAARKTVLNLEQDALDCS